VGVSGNWRIEMPETTTHRFAGVVLFRPTLLFQPGNINYYPGKQCFICVLFNGIFYFLMSSHP